MKNLVIACLVAVLVPAIAIVGYNAYVSLKEPEEELSDFVRLHDRGNLQPSSSVYY